MSLRAQRSNPTFNVAALDCFAALAMTGVESDSFNSARRLSRAAANTS
jgi:hypothetical protein